MPNRALRPCSYPGCPNLVRSGYCEQHRHLEVKQHILEYQRLYNHSSWNRLRAAQLARDPWCADCLAKDIYTPATDVDHIEPHRGDPVKFFAGRLQSLCHPCHSRKTLKELKGRGPEKVLNVGGASVRDFRAKKIPNVENPA